MKRLTFFINDELHRDLKFLSINLNMSMAEVIREILLHELSMQTKGEGRFKNDFEIVRRKIKS